MNERDRLGIRHMWLSVAVASLLPSFVYGQYDTRRLATSEPGSQGWRIVPALTVSEVYSDNITLAAPGSERSEWTTRIRPSITATENSARLRFVGTYAPELLYRARQGSTDISHYLDLLANAELWDRSLFLDARAGVSQQNVSLLAPQASNNVNITQNRTTVRTSTISPYWRQDFGVDAIGELRFTHDSANYSGTGGGFSSSRAARIDAKLGSGPAYRLLVWNLAASRSRLEYSQTGQTVSSQNFSASAGRLVTPDVRINASIGYDDSGYLSSTGSDLKGVSWSVGPEWTPTERTRIAANYGRRYFGPSRSVTINHRTSLSAWGLDYSEEATTTLGSFSRTVPCQVLYPLNPVLQQQCEQDRLTGNSGEAVNFLTNNFFLDKRLRANFGIQGVRNTITASVFTSNRTALTAQSNGTVSGDFASSSNIKQSGASIAWNTQLSPTLVANTSVSTIRNGFGTLARTDRLTNLRVGLTKEFNPKLSGTFAVARLKNDSNVAGGEYAENTMSATLGMRY